MVSVYSSSGTVANKSRLGADAFLQIAAAAYPAPTLDRFQNAVRWLQDGASDDFKFSTLLDQAFETAVLVVGLHVDPDVVISALLLPFHRSDAIPTDRIEQEFGPTVLKLVAGVRRMDIVDARIKTVAAAQHSITNAEALRKMLVAMVQDVRVAVLKLAERLYMLRHLDHVLTPLRDSLARDVLNYFAPLANRLGIWQLKWELEDLAFRQLQPDAYKKIAQRLSERRVDRDRYISQVIATLDPLLNQAGIRATIVGRAKHIYSIYRKMQHKDRNIEDIHDIRAIRILVSEVKDCYAALGVVHSLWAFLPDEFDDYIATPKKNNYRSIHTVVMGPGGKAIEVQIRTHAMHEHNEFGVAAHWRYKEGVSGDATVEQKITWLRQVLQWGGEVAATGAIVEGVSRDVFEQSVYVFTPAGDIVDLPRGATPLDFAYYVHTELGHRCRGAKVNGSMVPLTHVLETADRVEILTTKQGGPSRDWLNVDRGYLHSNKARAKVAHWFRRETQQRSAELGRQLLMRELTRLGKREEVRIETVARRLGFANEELFFAAIERGDVRVAQVIDVGKDPASITQSAEAVELTTNKVTVVSTPGHASPSVLRADGVLVVGVGNLLTHLAHCCHPIPGDQIVGFVTRGRGVTVHRADCSQIARVAADAPARIIDVSWGKSTQQRFLSAISITAVERPGLLRDASQLIEDEDVSVTSAKMVTQRSTQEAMLHFTVSITTGEQLNRVLDRIRLLPGVRTVRRL